MSQAYVKPLLLAAILLSGCASAPVDNTIIPTSDTPTKPVPPVKDAEGKHHYVLALMEKEEWHKAAEELELLTGARPKLAGPWVNLGIVRTMLGDSDAAELAFKRAVDADAGHAEAWNQLGIIRFGQLLIALVMGQCQCRFRQILVVQQSKVPVQIAMLRIAFKTGVVSCTCLFQATGAAV